MDREQSPPVVRFGVFEFDVREQSLRRQGLLIHLRPQVSQILGLLLAHPGEVVLRDTIRARLWGLETHVDFEQGIKSGIRHLRAALGDDAAVPRFIETVPGRGYRFIAPVPTVAAAVATAGDAGPGATWLASTLVLALAGVLVVAFRFAKPPDSPVHGPAQDPRVVVARFENRTGDPRLEDALNTALRLALQASPPEAETKPGQRLRVLGHEEERDALRRMERVPETVVDRAVGIEICRREGADALVVAQIYKVGDTYLLTSEIVEPGHGRPVFTDRAEAEDVGAILPALDGLSAGVRDFLLSGNPLLTASRPTSPRLEPVTTGSLEALQAFSTGLAHFRADRIDQALAFFQRAVDIDPDFAMAHLKLSQILWPTTEHVAAAWHMNQAASRRDRLTDVERLFVDAFASTLHGQPPETMRLWELVREAAPNRWEPYLHSGAVAYFGLNDFERAQDLLGTAAGVPAPPARTAQISALLGHALVALNRYDEAQRRYETFSGADIDVLTTCDLSLVSMAMERHAAAEATLSECVDGAPGWQRARSELLRLTLEIDRGDLEGAKAAAARAAAWGKELADVRHIAAARIAALAILEAQAPEPARHAEIVAILETDLDEGLALLSEEPDDPSFTPVPWLALLGRAAARAGLADRAEAVLETIRPRVGAGRSFVWLGHVGLLEGEVLLARGRPDDAVRKLEAVLHAPDGRPSPLHVLESLARAYEAAAAGEEAHAVYETLAAARGRSFVECLNGMICWDRPLNVLAARRAGVHLQP